MLQPKIESAKAIFEGAGEGNTWKVGQTLTIGMIIDHNGRERSSFVLEPQGIAHLISEEPLCLPENICALAHVLTRKCNDGLLTLNIGVIDPGWNGKISTSILNFSSSKRLLSKGDKFLRVTFHNVDMQTSEMPEKKKIKLDGDAGYISDVKSRAVSSFGQYFLNIRLLVNKLTEKETTRLRNTMIKYVPIAAFSLAFFAFLVTLSGAYAIKMLTTSGGASAQTTASKADDPQLNSQVEKLAASEKSQEAKIHSLETRLAAMEQKAAQSQPERRASPKVNTDTRPRP